MGSSDSLSIGKVPAQNVQGGAREVSKEEIKLAFKEVISRMPGMAEQGATVEKHMLDTEAVKKLEKPADVTRGCEDYAARSRNIKPGREKKLAADETVTERLDGFAEDVKEVLKEELGVTEEQLEEAMEMLGLTVVDLMNPNQLATLVMQLTGSEDMSALLCNSEFLAVMQKVGTLSDDLLSELGISAEEMEELLQQMATDAEPTVETAGLQMPSETEEKNASKPVDVATAAEEPQKAAEQEESIAKEIVPAAKEVSDTKEESESAEPLAVTEAPTEKKENFSEKGASQNGHPQNENGANIGMDAHVAERVEVPADENTGSFMARMDVENIIRQIAEFTRVTVGNHETTMEMQLNPANLGKIYLELTSKDGVVSAHITAQNEMVKEALESQLVEVRQNMNQAGVKVDAVEVTVGSHEFERNLEQNARQDEREGAKQETSAKQTRRLRLDELDALSGLMSDEETLVAQMMAEQGNSVDFTA